MIFNNLNIIYFLTGYHNVEITSYDHHLYNNIFIINMIIMLFYVYYFLTWKDLFILQYQNHILDII